ncbi:15294_t:CDS:2, partial [Cetraspora pellucida]
IPDALVADIQQILLKELIHLVEGLNNVIEVYVDESSESLSGDETNSDKKNRDFVLQNPKKRRRKGQPVGTKCFKLVCEKKSTKKQQRHYKKCGK